GLFEVVVVGHEVRTFLCRRRTGRAGQQAAENEPEEQTHRYSCRELVLAEEPGTDRFAAGVTVGYTAAERRGRARANRDTGSTFDARPVASTPRRAFCSRIERSVDPEIQSQDWAAIV